MYATNYSIVFWIGIPYNKDINPAGVQEQPDRST